MVGARRLQGIGTSVFSEMSRLAAEHNAVNLGQGFPDFAGPAFVKDAAMRAIGADLNQYAMSHGAPRLRTAIAATWARSTGRPIDPEHEVTVTTGATEALAAAMLALLDPGDEAVVFEPFYDAYLPIIAFGGASARLVTLRPPDWSFNEAELVAAVTPRTKLLLLNTPHNPTGKVFSWDELGAIATLCIRHDLIAVTDEVYDRIVYPPAEHVSLATLPGMWERTLTLNSTGKSFSLTGWKIGYAVGPRALNSALRAVHQFTTFATATPLQDAMATALETALAGGYYDQLRADYTARRDLLAAGLQAVGLPVLPIGGGYFLLADIERFGFPDDVAFCRYLTTEIGVAAIPPSAFYGEPARAPQLARFCFAKRAETIAAAATRLKRLPHPGRPPAEPR